jgi:hypothetical protein
MRVHSQNPLNLGKLQNSKDKGFEGILSTKSPSTSLLSKIHHLTYKLNTIQHVIFFLNEHVYISYPWPSVQILDTNHLPPLYSLLKISFAILETLPFYK